MASLRFSGLQPHLIEFLDFTSLTLDEFSSWSRPSRRRSTPGWRCAGWMGSRGPHASLPCTNLQILTSGGLD